MIILSVAKSVLGWEPIREHYPECVRLRRKFAILLLIGTHVQTLSVPSCDWLRSRIAISTLMEFGPELISRHQIVFCRHLLEPHVKLNSMRS